VITITTLEYLLSGMTFSLISDYVRYKRTHAALFVFATGWTAADFENPISFVVGGKVEKTFMRLWKVGVQSSLLL
jgi:hypothetical protein